MLTFLLGDWIERMRELPDGRYRTCITSTPYYGLREYLPGDHPRVHLEVGREPTIQGYVGAIDDGARDIRRLLSEDGTLWLNLGDAYANDSKWGGATGGKHAKRLHGKSGVGRARRQTGLPPKCLIGMPWRVALAMIDDGWILRADIIWEKPNAMPHPAGDRPALTHEHVFLFTKSERYFFNANAIREPARYQASGNSARKLADGTKARPGTHMGRSFPWKSVDGMRQGRSVWSIPPEAGEGDHAAPMPRALARRCLLAGTEIGDHAIDPFGGSGTLGVVAEEEGRHATLIELDERAISFARERCAQVGLFGRAPD